MTPDLEKLFERAAVPPTTPVDAAALVQTAIARKRRQRVVVGVTAAAAGAAFVVLAVLGTPTHEVEFAERPPAASEPAVDSRADAPQRNRSSPCFAPAAGSPPLPRTGSADVDGDRRADNVAIRGTPTGRNRCAYTLVVNTNSGRLHGEIPLSEFDVQTAPGYVRLKGFYELNQEPGYEIVVRTALGASGASHLAFTVSGNAVEVLADDGAPAVFGDFSSAGHGDLVDCTDNGVVRLEYGITNDGKRFIVERSVFDVRHAALVLRDRRVRRIEYEELEDLTRPFADQLLPHCAQPPTQ